MCEKQSCGLLQLRANKLHTKSTLAYSAIHMVCRTVQYTWYAVLWRPVSCLQHGSSKEVVSAPQLLVLVWGQANQGTSHTLSAGTCNTVSTA